MILYFVSIFILLDLVFSIMPKGNKQNYSRRKKRTNSHLHNTTNCAHTRVVKKREISLRMSKLKLKSITMTTLFQDHPLHKSESDDVSCIEKDYYILINFSILKSLFEKLGHCMECGNAITLRDNLAFRMGFCHCLEIRCSFCEDDQKIYTSKSCEINLPERDSGGRLPYEVNVRSIVAFREIGRGHQSIERFSVCMNIYGLAENAFHNLNKRNGLIYNAYKKAAQISIDKAVASITKDSDLPSKQRVTMDGTWQKRGHTSKNGIITAIIGKTDYEG